MLPGCCCIANRHIGARERRQLIPHVRFQVPFLGPESQLKSGFACAGLLCRAMSKYISPWYLSLLCSICALNALTAAQTGATAVQPTQPTPADMSKMEQAALRKGNIHRYLDTIEKPAMTLPCGNWKVEIGHSETWCENGSKVKRQKHTGA